MEYGDLIKIYGPLALFVPMYIWLLRFVLSNYNADIESRLKIADAINRMAATIEKWGKDHA